MQYQIINMNKTLIKQRKKERRKERRKECVSVASLNPKPLTLSQPEEMMLALGLGTKQMYPRQKRIARTSSSFCRRIMA
jgi:hypothetical protein